MMVLAKFKSIGFYTFIILVLLNALYAAFFFDKSYQNIKISAQVTVNANARVWFVYKNKNSEERFFSEVISAIKNKPHTLHFNIQSKTALDYVGLFWKAPQKSTLKIENYICTRGNDTILDVQNSNAIQYINPQSILTHEKENLLVNSTNSERNWVMLNYTNALNDLRDIKNHKPIPILYNIILFVIIFIFQLTHGKLKLVDKSYFSITEVRVKIVRLWVFILPFWTIISHTLLAISFVLSLIQIINNAKRKVLFKELEHFTPFFIFYMVVIITAVFSSTPDQFLNTVVDYLYFLLIPFVFLSFNKKHLTSLLNWFEYGIICYLILLAIYILNQHQIIKPEVSFFKFIETTTEIFWHTSYLSALILIVLIKKLDKTVNINWQLILLFILLLSYMYIVNARLPFVLGVVIVLWKFLDIFKSKKVKLLYGCSVALVAFSLLLLFLFKPLNNSQATTSSSSDIVSLDARLTLWEATLRVASGNLIYGVGVENTTSTIANQISKESTVKLRKFNAHNQFLEILLSSGIFGALSFLFLFYLGFKKNNVLTAAFTIVYILLFMVESYLQRQAGMVFFVLWFGFFINYALKNDERNNLY